jgi:hypothetical protein
VNQDSDLLNSYKPKCVGSNQIAVQNMHGMLLSVKCGKDGESMSSDSTYHTSLHAFQTMLQLYLSNISIRLSFVFWTMLQLVASLSLPL